MRQYRGLTKDGKDFVYGWYFELDNLSFIEYQSKKSNNRCTIEVRPETVGQQIGKQDENDKEIYEGDIIEYYSALVPKGTNPTKRQTVKWNKRIAGFTDCHSGGKVIGDIHTTPKEKL